MSDLKIGSKINIFLLAIVLMLGLYMPDLFAADFTPDTSTAFLSVLFGSVSDSFNTVLHGGQSIIGVVFEYFNGFVATVGAAIVTYVVTVSLLYSSSSGKPLGDKWHTLFFPMRVTAGAGMLIPNAFGFNFAQVVTMWFILTGVNAADEVWSQVINKLSVGNEAVTGSTANSDSTFDYFAYLRPAINFASCVGSYGPTPPSSSGPVRACANSYPTCTPLPAGLKCVPKDDCSKSNGEFPKIVPENAEIASKCGSLIFGNVTFTDKNAFDSYVSKVKSLVATQITETRNFYTYMTYNPSSALGIYDIDLSMLTAAEQVSYASDLLGKITPASVTRLSDAVYVAMQKQAAADAGKNLVPYSKTAKDIGWIAAGATYYGIITNGGGQTAGSIPSYIGEIMGNANVPATQAFAKDVNKTIAAELNVSPSGSGSDDSTASLRFSQSYNNKLLSAIGLGIPLLIEYIVQHILDTDQLFDYPDSIQVRNDKSIRDAIKADPLAKIAEQGAHLTSMCEEIFFGFLTALIAAGLLMAVLPTCPTGIAFAALIPIITMVLFAVVSVMMIFYPIGIIMNVYVPLIPFLIYTMGVIGWLLLCIEAMAAAPIVALGLMHPQGDEVLGQAEHGLKLLLNLMLRPVLMVAGLAAGIVLVRIAILFFSMAMNLVFNTGIIPVTSLAAMGASLMIYIGSMTVIIHKCFSLINEIPNKVMAWIGAQGSSVGGADEILQEAKGKTEQGGKMPGEVGKGGYEGAQSGYKQGSNMGKPQIPGKGGGGGSTMG
ncbi:MAG: DotA/TraY family protein [Gammaproteobacteria bacterium]|nr:DotA/TraY family protein [Gammaproteobacteria bacterium]